MLQCTETLSSYENLSEWAFSNTQTELFSELEFLKKENLALKEASICDELSAMLDKSNMNKIQFLSDQNSQFRFRIDELLGDRDRLSQQLQELKYPTLPTVPKPVEYNFGQKILQSSVSLLDDFLNGSKLDTAYTEKELTDKVLQAFYYLLASFLSAIVWLSGVLILRRKGKRSIELPKNFVESTKKFREK